MCRIRCTYTSNVGSSSQGRDNERFTYNFFFLFFSATRRESRPARSAKTYAAEGVIFCPRARGEVFLLPSETSYTLYRR